MPRRNAGASTTSIPIPIREALVCRHAEELRLTTALSPGRRPHARLRTLYDEFPQHPSSHEGRTRPGISAGAFDFRQESQITAATHPQAF